MSRAQEQLGARVRELRYRKGMTQSQLAARAGVGEKTLKRLEAGKTDTPHPETLAAVAGALGLEPEALFAPASERSASSAPAIHQLPRPPYNFTGRAAELAELEEQRARGVAISAIHGMGGIGKTALALVTAERFSEEFADAQFYLDLFGTEQPVAPSEAMLHVIRSVEPGRPPPSNQAEVEAVYRSVLRGKRCLLLLDNAVGREQVEPLVPPEGCLLLITSRQRFLLPGMCSVALLPFDEAEARALIDSLAPRARPVGAELAGLCGGLPLALSLAARAISERPDLDPREYTTRLADDRSRLRQLDAAGLTGGVEASFSLSYEMLDTDLQQGLCTLSVFSHHFDRAAAGVVWGLPEQETDQRIGTLVRFNLLESSGAGASARYRLHDLVRLFASARLEKLDPELRRAARLRHAQHFIELLCRVNSALRTGRELDAAFAEGLPLVDREWPHIKAAFGHCRERAPRDPQAARLCCLAADAVAVLSLRLHADERIDWYRAAFSLLDAEPSVDDRPLLGRLHAHLGRARQELGDPRAAIDDCQRALSIAVAQGQRHDEAYALVALGDAHHAVGYPEQAIDYGERGLALARELGATLEEAGALIVVGWGCRVRGDAAAAIEYCEQCLPLARELRDRSREGSALLALAFSHLYLRQHDRARQRADGALAIAREIGDRRMEGYALIARRDEAGVERSVAIARETGDRRLLGNALLGLGISQRRQGRAGEAVALLEQSLSIAQETGDRSMEGGASLALGHAYTGTGELSRAIEALQRGEQVSRAIGNRSQQALAAFLLGDAHERAGHLDHAIDALERSAAYQREVEHEALAQTRARIADLRARAGLASRDLPS